MKKIGLLLIFVFLFLTFTSACTNEDEGINREALGDTNDLDTLLKNNENLLKELDKKQEEVEDINLKLEGLISENLSLKNDILTFKQKIFDIEDLMVEERVLRNKLDEKAQYIFEAMNDRDHQQLEGLLADNVKVNRETSTLEIEINQIISTFDFVNLSNVSYVRQGDYKHDPDEKLFSLQYIMYVEEVKGEERLEKSIYLTFIQEKEWKLTQISQIPIL